MKYLVQLGNGVVFAGPFDTLTEAEEFAYRADVSQEYTRYSVQIGQMTSPENVHLTPFPSRD